MPENAPLPVDSHQHSRMREAAERLLAARRTLEPIADLPAELRPLNIEDAYLVQDTMAQALGEIGGWKIGAPSPTATPLFGPMALLGGFAVSGTRLGRTAHRLRGLEAEIAFRMGSDLPARSTPYTREEVVAAIGSCHPAIEILESAFEDPDKVDRLSMIGDLQMNGGFAYGQAIRDWQTIDFAKVTASMIVDGAVRVEATGSNTAGTDLVRLVVWLANEAQSRTGGLSKGDWITTGSWTGKTLVQPRSEGLARFSGCGEVAIYFE